MYFFYQFLLFLAVICSPIILLIRFLKDKEDKKRFVEKFGFIKEKRIKGIYYGYMLLVLASL